MRKVQVNKEVRGTRKPMTDERRKEIEYNRKLFMQLSNLLSWREGSHDATLYTNILKALPNFKEVNIGVRNPTDDFKGVVYVPIKKGTLRKGNWARGDELYAWVEDEEDTTLNIGIHKQGKKIIRASYLERNETIEEATVSKATEIPSGENNMTGKEIKEKILPNATQFSFYNIYGKSLLSIEVPKDRVEYLIKSLGENKTYNLNIYPHKGGVSIEVGR